MQAAQAKKFERDRPDFLIPQEEQQALNSAKYQASLTELPGQDLMEQKLGRSTSNALIDLNRSADSPSAILGNIAEVYDRQMQKQNDLDIAAAKMFVDNQGVLRNELHSMGEWKAREWDYNENQPYQAGAAAASAARGSGMQNIMTGVSNATGAGSNYLFAKELMKDYQDNWQNQLMKQVVQQQVAGNATYNPSPTAITTAPVTDTGTPVALSQDPKYKYGLFDSIPFGGITN